MRGIDTVRGVVFPGGSVLNKQYTITTAMLLVLVTLGCGANPNVVPVSGVVLLDGKPLVGASVNTQPIASSSGANPGSGSFGRTDAEGRYSLEVVDPPMPGAYLGEHRVTITQPDEVEYRSTDEMVVPTGPPWPTRYSDGSLRMTVQPEGTTTVDFELTLDGK